MARRGRSMLAWCALAASLTLGIAPPSAMADGIPSSRRSRRAVARVRPGLEAALAEQGLRFGAPIFLRIHKRELELELWVRGGARFRLFRTYRVCAASGGPGPKLRQGDGQAPEGFYFVPPSALNPASSFHLSFNLGFPNAYDRWHRRTGSALMVHGSCVSDGCFAMRDGPIEEIYAMADAALRGGQPFFRVHLLPFRMTEANLAAQASSRWLPFWLNLREGHAFFESRGYPPNVEVREGRYVFEEPGEEP